MTMFGLTKQKASYINGKKSIKNYYYQAQKHYASSMTSFLMKALISGDNPYQNWLSQVDIVKIIYGCSEKSYSAMPKNLGSQAKAIFIWYTKQTRDLKMIHDEDKVLIDSCKSMKMLVYIYGMNIPGNIRQGFEP